MISGDQLEGRGGVTEESGAMAASAGVFIRWRLVGMITKIV
jgi:hypothetical protein